MFKQKFKTLVEDKNVSNDIRATAVENFLL
jgi:hypothetical protein